MCHSMNMSNNDRYRRFNLRIPKETFDLLQEAADARSHSMNAEIVQRLEDSMIPTPAEISPLYAAKAASDNELDFYLQQSFQLLISKGEEYERTINDHETHEVEKALSLYELKQQRREFERFFTMAKKRGIPISSEIAAKVKEK